MKAFLKLRILAILAIAIVGVQSCKKGDDSIIFPLEVYGTKVEVSSATRLFTKDGEIKDARKIAKFVDKSEYFQTEDNKNALGRLAMTFLSKDSVLFDGDSNRFGVSQNGNQFIFTSSKAFLPIATNSLTDHILAQLFKHKNVVSDVTIPVFNGSGGYIAKGLREVRVAYGNFVELKFPLLAYSAKSKVGTEDAYSVASNSGLTNNELDVTAPSYLKGNDTLAVKLYMLTCRKK